MAGQLLSVVTSLVWSKEGSVRGKAGVWTIVLLTVLSLTLGVCDSQAGTPAPADPKRGAL
jgi:hypothetical protein